MEVETMEKLEVIEKTFVHDVYDYMAENLPNSTVGDMGLRASVERYLKNLNPGTSLLDIGCGNGKHLNINEQVFAVGCDLCSAFVQYASSSNPTNQLMLADNLNLPYRSHSFDHVLSVAVLHHFASEKRRLIALEEMFRLLSVGGTAYICVWAREQSNRNFSSQDVFIPLACQRNKLNSFPSSKRKPSSSTSSYDEERENKPVSPVKKIANNCFDTPRSHNNDSSFARVEKVTVLQSDRNLIEILSSFNVSSVLQNFANTSIWDVREWKRKSSLNVRKTTQKDPDAQNWKQVERQTSVNETRIGSKNQEKHPEEHQEGKDPRGAVFAVKKPVVRSRSTGIRNSLRGKSMTSSVGFSANDRQMRYYHVFRAGELDDLIKDFFPEMEIKESFFEHGNWCLIVQKIKSNFFN